MDDTCKFDEMISVGAGSQTGSDVAVDQHRDELRDPGRGHLAVRLIDQSAHDRDWNRAGEFIGKALGDLVDLVGK